MFHQLSEQSIYFFLFIYLSVYLFIYFYSEAATGFHTFTVCFCCFAAYFSACIIKSPIQLTHTHRGYSSSLLCLPNFLVIYACKLYCFIKMPYIKFFIFRGLNRVEYFIIPNIVIFLFFLTDTKRLERVYADSPMYSPFLYLSLSLTHTHTHTHLHKVMDGVITFRSLRAR